MHICVIYLDDDGIPLLKGFLMSEKDVFSVEK